MSNLTLEALQAAIDRARGVLYYGTSDAITPGKVLIQEGRSGMPQAIYCHPDDLEGLHRQIPQRLVHIREWQPTTEDTFEWQREMVNQAFRDELESAVPFWWRGRLCWWE